MKKVAITTRVDITADTLERRDGLSQEWMDLLEACDLLPIIMPNHVELVKKMIMAYQPEGILLTGGNDLACCGGTAADRDETETLLLDYAVRQELPVLGVCRGMQMLLHYFGTPLEPVHDHVRVEHLLQSGNFANSFHNWGVYECNAPLAATEIAEDGVVEGVRHSSLPIYGVMWHPERYHPFREEDIQRVKGVFN